MNTQYSENRIKIRPYRDGDAELLYEAARESIDEVYPWLEWCHPEYSIDDSREWIERTQSWWKQKTEFHFAIFPADEDRLLGGCGLNHIDAPHKVANLGYWVRSSATGQGIATTATIQLARYAFDKLKFNRLEIVMSVENSGSQRVAEKAAATNEGRLRNRLLLHERQHDAFLFSLLPGDLPYQEGVPLNGHAHSDNG